MKILKLEDQRQQLIKDIHAEKCSISRIILFHNFFNQVCSTKDESIIESFLTEFKDQYILSLSTFNPIGLNPNLIDQIVEFAQRFSKSVLFQSNRSKIENEILRIVKIRDEINDSLNGITTSRTRDITFPVNIRANRLNKKFGQIENISIKIHTEKSLDKNNFIVIPSNQKLEERLLTQVKNSWELATNFLKSKYTRVKKNHEVIIIFSHKNANYEGYSLGLALTLGFIQELFKFYNTELNLIVNENITFTGGIDSKGNIKQIGENSLETKMQTVFFSQLNVFALPDKDFQSAKYYFDKLKKDFPNRKLKLISIEDFEDLLNHRKLVQISRASISERTKKYVKKNVLVLIMYMTLISILAFVTIFKNDNNPVEFEQVGEQLNIINSHGKILWSTEFRYLSKSLGEQPKYFHKVFDIDGDGINEVILSHENLEDKGIENQGRIACFDNNKNLVWKYKFRDQVSTDSAVYKDEYSSRLLDIINLNGINTLFCVARHVYFPSAVFKLNIKTGKRLKGTLWSQGHFVGGEIGDFSEDGKPEIFIGGINNGTESAFALISTLEDLKGQTPTINKYIFKNIEQGKFIKYLLFPKSDLCQLFENRFNGSSGVHYYNDTKTFKVGVNEKYPYKDIGPMYVFNHQLDSAWLQIGDDFQYVRDDLIKAGKLKPPYTNTKLYEKKLISNIKEWNGKKFVNFVRNAKK